MLAGGGLRVNELLAVRASLAVATHDKDDDNTDRAKQKTQRCASAAGALATTYDGAYDGADDPYDN